LEIAEQWGYTEALRKFAEELKEEEGLEKRGSKPMLSI
jgi:hypothetical protein